VGIARARLRRRSAPRAAAAARSRGAGDTFVLVNGDTLTDVDLPAMIDDHRRTARW
jgi:NDP-sugar pyrophosphorylase family protein